MPLRSERDHLIASGATASIVASSPPLGAFGGCRPAVRASAVPFGIALSSCRERKPRRSRSVVSSTDSITMPARRCSSASRFHAVHERVERESGGQLDDRSVPRAMQRDRGRRALPTCPSHHHHETPVTDRASQVAEESGSTKSRELASASSVISAAISKLADLARADVDVAGADRDDVPLDRVARGHRVRDEPAGVRLRLARGAFVLLLVGRGRWRLRGVVGSTSA